MKRFVVFISPAVLVQCMLHESLLNAYFISRPTQNLRLWNSDNISAVLFQMTIVYYFINKKTFHRSLQIIILNHC